MYNSNSSTQFNLLHPYFHTCNFSTLSLHRHHTALYYVTAAYHQRPSLAPRAPAGQSESPLLYSDQGRDDGARGDAEVQAKVFDPCVLFRDAGVRLTIDCLLSSPLSSIVDQFLVAFLSDTRVDRICDE